MGIEYWCFERITAEAAIDEFCAEIAAGEGNVNPEAAAADARLIRDFLNSNAVRRRGMIKQPGDDHA